MRIWRKRQQALGGRLIAASNLTEVQEKIIDIPEPKSCKQEIRLDDGLYDD
jgi:hypothetical protein